MCFPLCADAFAFAYWCYVYFVWLFDLLFGALIVVVIV